MAVRRIIDAVDELVTQLRVANQIAALELGTSGLDDVDPTVTKNTETARRQVRMNKPRAGIRTGLDLKEDGHGD